MSTTKDAPDEPAEAAAVDTTHDLTTVEGNRAAVADAVGVRASVAAMCATVVRLVHLSHNTGDRAHAQALHDDMRDNPDAWADAVEATPEKAERRSAADRVGGGAQRSQR
jgi:hypothetical protein